jgi:hypothetical protein
MVSNPVWPNLTKGEFAIVCTNKEDLGLSDPVKVMLIFLHIKKTKKLTFSAIYVNILKMAGALNKHIKKA